MPPQTDSRPHPAKGVLVMRGIRLREPADELDYNRQYFRKVINGLTPASATFRAKLARWLDMPEHELFRDGAE